MNNSGFPSLEASGVVRFVVRCSSEISVGEYLCTVFSLLGRNSTKSRVYLEYIFCCFKERSAGQL